MNEKEIRSRIESLPEEQIFKLFYEYLGRTIHWICWIELELKGIWFQQNLRKYDEGKLKFIPNFKNVEEDDFGTILTKVKKLDCLPKDIISRLDECHETRNTIVHRVSQIFYQDFERKEEVDLFNHIRVVEGLIFFDKTASRFNKLGKDMKNIKNELIKKNIKYKYKV